MSYANNTSADQPVHLRSLIGAFAVHCLDSIISMIDKLKISRHWLVSVARRVRLGLTWSQMPKDEFSHDRPQIMI